MAVLQPRLVQARHAQLKSSAPSSPTQSKKVGVDKELAADTILGCIVIWVAFSKVSARCQPC